MRPFHASRRQVLHLVLATSASVAGVRYAHASDDYPSRPVRMIVPYPAGGGVDVQARVVAERLKQALGQPVVVENISGAGGRIGLDQVLRSAPDGYNLLWGGLTSHVLNPAFATDVKYDSVADFTSVGMAIENPIVLVASLKLGVSNFAEFVALLKANPDKYAYGSAGVGTSTHIGVEMLLQTLGLKALHVPYKGSAPVMNDLYVGSIQFAVDSVGATTARIQARELIGLLVLNTTRSGAIPDVPCLVDAGVPGVDNAKLVSWQGLFGPAKLPQPIVARLNKALEEALADPVVVSKLKAMGLPVMLGYTPEKSAALLREDLARWKEFARTSGIRID
ncbi:tripartite tricarboxylate transporter substrate binding protein [Bradyrhizobium sp. LHD-71]|uniref:Bug family tripartite tricarboxylate transporter substrate binding protein n=1 Tax=Bradyrhizobium sp. LHD-71 TaxID=3072141 RepID=UPI0028100815|nr:tripartite tricarboxylate transporter substrate binding protein [Bradyrhizobium sp. LHD-71]MDQ8727423.1 tripartite tricarboxylate transporter substrate binding protein [Bradyrhizobium sp. LHD-71]